MNKNVKFTITYGNLSNANSIILLNEINKISNGAMIILRHEVSNTNDRKEIIEFEANVDDGNIRDYMIEFINNLASLMPLPVSPSIQITAKCGDPNMGCLSFSNYYKEASDYGIIEDFDISKMYPKKVYLKKKKLVFFDFDGTLIIPRYIFDGHITPGINSSWWMIKNLHINGEYQKDFNVSHPIPQMLDILRWYDNEGYDIFVLTGIMSSKESDNKFDFCCKHYVREDGEPIINRSHFIGVADINYKRDIIDFYKEEYQITEDEIDYWDDSHPMVMKMAEDGYNAHHAIECITFMDDLNKKED